MAKYHNGANGPSICKATTRPCPIRGEHFDSKEKAQEAFEKTMNQKAPSNPLKKTSQKKNSSITYGLAEAQQLFAEAADAEGRVTTEGIIKHSPAEWRAIADALNSESNRLWNELKAEDLGEKLENKYHINEYVKDWNKKLTDPEYVYDEALPERDRTLAAQHAFTNSPDFAKESEDLIKFSEKSSLMAKTRENCDAALVAAELATEREFMGERVPAGYDTFTAIYDLKGHPMSYYPTRTDFAPTKGVNSDGEKIKIRPSQHRDPAKAEAANRAKGFTIGTVIAPALASPNPLTTHIISTKPNRMDIDALSSDPSGTSNGGSDFTDEERARLLDKVYPYYNEVPEIKRSRSLRYRQPSSLMNVTSAKDFKNKVKETQNNGITPNEEN